MQGLIDEINQIPQKAEDCLAKNQNTTLPTNTPYIGMGSSYYAPLTLHYAGANIYPHIASEYYYYLPDAPQAVLLSQSGESSETVWCLEKFDHVTSITNHPNSTLATSPKTQQNIDIHAGPESFSSTKTYTNTLITLYAGLGIDIAPAVQQLASSFESYQQPMQKLAKQITTYLKKTQVKGLYIIGSGPNSGTALEAALTLSETTKLSWQGMPVAQYDHGPKETADDTIVLAINANGRDAKRIASIKSILSQNSNAFFAEITEATLPEQISPITLITKLNLLMNYLADELRVGDTFTLGGKVTTVDDKSK